MIIETLLNTNTTIKTLACTVTQITVIRPLILRTNHTLQDKKEGHFVISTETTFFCHFSFQKRILH